MEDVADSQQAADRSQEAQKREDDGGVHRMHAPAVVARQQAGQDEQETEGGGNERGQADRVGQDVAAESEDDENGAECDRRCRHAGIIAVIRAAPIRRRDRR